MKTVEQDKSLLGHVRSGHELTDEQIRETFDRLGLSDPRVQIDAGATSDSNGDQECMLNSQVTLGFVAHECSASKGPLIHITKGMGT
jgi:hypothetical protein